MLVLKEAVISFSFSASSALRCSRFELCLCGGGDADCLAISRGGVMLLFLAMVNNEVQTEVNAERKIV